MEDPNFILTIIAIDQESEKALCLKHNEQRYVPPTAPVYPAADISSREPTPSQGSEEGEIGDEDSRSRLRLTFDKEKAPKDSRLGWVFGTDPRISDILLTGKRRERGLSGRHFCITFDEQRRIVLKDMSKNGTAVSYTLERRRKNSYPFAGQAQGHDQRRHNFTWILFDGWKIKVHILEEDFTFEVQLARHETCKAEFQALMNTYLEQSRNLEESQSTSLPFSLLDIYSQESTAPPSQSLSPRQRPIYLSLRELGSGACGAVHKVVDVSTGEYFAAKQFSKGFDSAMEVEILKRLSHEHIVQFVDFADEHAPLLVMEYLPLGDLHHQHSETPLSVEEVEMLLHQSLAALQYLHDRMITHRDIKPLNILVKGRAPSFQIKLADFGLSKDVVSLRTACGTGSYAAPEIWKAASEPKRKPGAISHPRPAHYNAMVDIWSLGVVILELLDLLQIDGHQHGLKWCKTVARIATNATRRGQMFLLLSRMLRLGHEERPTASHCLNMAEDFGFDHPNMSKLDDQSARFGPQTGLDDGDEEEIGSLGSITPRAGSFQACETQHETPTTELEMSSARPVFSDSNATVIGPHKRRRPPATLSRVPSPSPGKRDNKRRQADDLRNTGPISRTYALSEQSSGPADQSAPFMTTYDTIVAFLRDLRVGSNASVIPDDRTFVLVEDICTHLIRLRITELGAIGPDQSNNVTITATSNNQEMIIANLTSSEILNSVPSLAAHLLHMLAIRSFEAQKMARSSPSEKDPQPEPGLEASGYLTGVRDQSQSHMTAMSALSARALGLTYPSDLLDETRVSGCSIPTLNSC